MSKKRFTAERRVLADVSILDIAEKGKGVAKVDELVVFVDKAIPGDVVDVEFGGPSAIYSITYDTRFARRSDGWGFRGGIGFWPRRGINHISIPVQVNYLLGGTRHFFEAGAGATYFHGDQGDSWFSPATEGSLVFGSLSAGYRYQPRSQGITARIGITGIVGPFSSNSIAPLPYLSVGYRF